MIEVALGLPDLVFVLFSLAISLWAVIAPERLLTVLSLGRTRQFTRTEQLIIRAPGCVVVVGLVGLLIKTAITGLR